MAFEINKPSVWIPIALTIIGLVAAGIVGAYHEFTTVSTHERDRAALRAEIAGVSLNQQLIATRSNIKWLMQEIYELEKRYGDDPGSMPPDVSRRYKDLLRQLEDERRLYNDLRQRIRQ